MTQPVVTVREGSALDEVARTLLEHRIGGVPVVEVVLFQIIHIGNYRSETKSALRLSPFRSPFLLWGSVTALLVHVAAMHLPLGQRILGTEPVSLTTWIVLYALALTILGYGNDSRQNGPLPS